MKLAWDSHLTLNRQSGKYVRKVSIKPYHTRRWMLISKNFRHDHPLCQMCLLEGKYEDAKVVDHIIPVPICDDFYDTSNLQSLCERHNIIKGNKDKKAIEDYKRLHPDWETKYDI